MVIAQLLIDSVSRCFGVPSESTPNSPTLCTQPLGASKESKQQSTDYQSNPKSLNSSYSSEKGQCRPNSNNNSILLDNQQDNDSEVLAKARHAASLSSKCYSGSSKPAPPHKASLEKTRSKYSQRKLDIFRSRNRKQPSTPTFASRLLGEGSFPSGAMLCFANPVFDDEEDDANLQRVDEMFEDEETVTSTLYFDAKYEHLVETQPPFALYPSFKVDEDILNIFQSGSHKSITSISCPTPPPPPKQTTEMGCMADETSVDSSETSSVNEQEETTEDWKNQCNKTNNINNYVMNSAPPPHVSQPQDLDVISQVVLSKDRQDSIDKLRSKSSVSTAALTPVCSSQSQTSLSPRQQRQYQDAVEMNDIHSNELC